ncbi:uncharacterized protein RHOBADRAFT_44178 [Rhodotorula graminis WP1]|uniref:Uncharacterized protein n=1 Tax=Rhodotorula graminis (strain WP1) TaxID=578459 RepID=A0A194S1Q6_RHOGW|nr:uncharacterized protein RHOBADRAFT_44178 [Rhodotorula graminis WP1]KPV74663.1 hypothetical protein RHOBADRAFT_44178 [Rhodotorula graminis WP1]
MAARRIQSGVLGARQAYTAKQLQRDADLVQAPIDTARRALGLDATSSSMIRSRERPSPSPTPPTSPHTPLSRRSASPIRSPIRVRAPSTVTRFYAALFDHPVAPPDTRTPPTVSRAYAALRAAAHKAVTPDVWDEMCSMRRGDESCAKVALGALAAAKDAVVGRPPGRSIDARVQQIKSAENTIINELVSDALDALKRDESRTRRRSGRSERREGF